MSVFRSGFSGQVRRGRFDRAAIVIGGDFLKRDWLETARPFLQETFSNDHSGHDYYHTLRVFQLASGIQGQEGGDLETVQLAALLHDVDDYKLFGGPMGGSLRARAFMEEQGVQPDRIEEVCGIIQEVSYKAKDSKVPHTLEGQIVQDADRLDAMGAVGIARTFAYGGSRGRAIYTPGEEPALDMTAEEYANHQSCTINHFYEKLLLLKDQMNTPAARILAEDRHRFMQLYLDEFFGEWEGER